MKIQLSSTLPFTPVQLDSRHVAPRRAVGELHGQEGTREYRTAVYEFRHSDEDRIHYQIDPQDRVYLDELLESDEPAVALENTQSAHTVSSDLEWIAHDDSLTYKPYAFLVMNAMTKLVGNWDGVIYRTPSGERLRDAVWNTTLQVVDACVCDRRGLWVKVNLVGDTGGTVVDGAVDSPLPHQLGWVPLHAAAH
jgi:hypothetical protein